MLAAFAKGVDQLGDPRTRRVVWISLAGSVGVVVALWALVGAVLTQTSLFEIGWLDAAIDVLGGLAVAVITWLLFPAVVSAFIGLYLDAVADAVERRHYPHLSPAREAPLGEVVATTLRFLAVMVALNLVVLIFLLFPPVFPFVFYAVNGYLLGREYFELVALRRLDAAAARSLQAEYRGPLFLAGVVIALLLTVPLVNLIAPIIGAAAMVHLFEGWRRRGGGAREAGAR